MDNDYTQSLKLVGFDLITIKSKLCTKQSNEFQRCIHRLKDDLRNFINDISKLKNKFTSDKQDLNPNPIKGKPRFSDITINPVDNYFYNLIYDENINPITSIVFQNIVNSKHEYSFDEIENIFSDFKKYAENLISELDNFELAKYNLDVLLSKDSKVINKITWKRDSLKLATLLELLQQNEFIAPVDDITINFYINEKVTNQVSSSEIINYSDLKKINWLGTYYELNHFIDLLYNCGLISQNVYESKYRFCSDHFLRQGNHFTNDQMNKAVNKDHTTDKATFTLIEELVTSL